MKIHSIYEYTYRNCFENSIYEKSELTEVSKNVIFRTVQSVLWKNVYMCYNYVHLDNLLDISAYRTVVKPQRTIM